MIFGNYKAVLLYCLVCTDFCHGTLLWLLFLPILIYIIKTNFIQVKSDFTYCSGFLFDLLDD